MFVSLGSVFPVVFKCSLSCLLSPHMISDQLKLELRRCERMGSHSCLKLFWTDLGSSKSGCSHGRHGSGACHPEANF